MNTSRTLWLGLLLALVGCEVQPRDEVMAAPPEQGSATVRPFTCDNTGDTEPPEVTLTVAGGGTVSGPVLITAQATDNVLVEGVYFLLNGRHFSSDDSAPFELAWDTREVFNGPVVFTAEAYDASCNGAVSPELTLLVDNPGQAAFSTALGVPECASVGSSCDTGSLLSGRGPVGPELNHPNTLGGTCVDGALGSYPGTMSLEQLKVFTLDGSPLNAGRRVRLKASFKKGYNYAGHMMEFFHAPDANAPVWTMIASILPRGSYREVAEEETDFVLPAGTQLQAIRGAYRFHRHDSDAQCEPNANSGEDDYDDLVFAVGNETDDQPPGLALIAPVDGVIERGAIDFRVEATDNFAVSRVEFFLDDTLVLTTTQPPFNSSAIPDLPNGTYTVTARAWDGAGNSTTTAPRTLHLDNDYIPPTVSLLSPGEGTTVEGTVSLQATASDEDRHPGGVEYVYFYVDGAFHSYTFASNGTYTRTWDTLRVPNGPHVVTAKAVDNGGNEAFASVNVLVDNDLTAPTVSITSPASGAIVSETVEVTASASDNRGVTRVDFFVGYQLVGSDTTAPYSFNWDTRPLVHGSGHTLMAKAYDARGQVGTHSLNVVVNDRTAPTVAITSPTEGAVIRGSISFQANASDNRRVSRVEFYDGATLLYSDAYASYGLSWSTSTLPDGPHTLTVKAYDEVGNVSTASITVIVDNRGPTLSFTAPQAQLLRGIVPVQVTATTYVAPVTKVEFVVDSTLFHTALSAPYTASWDTRTRPDGTYILRARGYDTLGRMGSVGMIVEVDNTAPTVSLTSPAAGTVINQPTTLTASASDARPVVRVEFYAGSTLVGTDTTAPYSAPWTPPAKGSYTLTAKAYDTAGNVGTSAGVTVQGK